ncbi:MAG: DUF4157 domain-containing protein [Ktedonobacteraceae bacterium]
MKSPVQSHHQSTLHEYASTSHREPFQNQNTQTSQQEAEEIWQLAQAGLQTPTYTLPYVEHIQQLFGHHDISGIQAHIGAQATASARAMHAIAYATDNHVVFASWPDLYTVAHETAHIVQQRTGVQLAYGIGTVGDSYERHADAVAERVVAGESVQNLLDWWLKERHNGQNYAKRIENCSGGKRCLQRRLISDAAEAQFITNAVGAEAVNNLEGLRWIVKRTIQMLNATDANRLTAQVPNYQTLLTGNGTHLLQLTARMKVLFPGMVYPGHQDTFTLPRNPTEQGYHNTRSTMARDTLYHIANNNADRNGIPARTHIEAVFGNVAPYGRDQVIPRFQGALDKLNDFVTQGRVYTDMSGALDAMNAGAITPFDGHVQMKQAFLMAGDDREQAIGLAHEAFHAAYRDITDDGGYSQPEEPFKTSLADVKFTNAAHYEEVVRRFMGANPVGGIFVPENAPGAPARSDLQKAVGRASRRLQIAWERALNVHGFLINHIFHALPTNNTPLAYFSSLLKLTIHQRVPTLPPGSFVTVNDIDLVGAETATRMLALTRDRIDASLLTPLEQVGTIDELTDRLINNAIVATGQITGDTVRDARAVRDLAGSDRNPQIVTLAPVLY